MNHKQSQNESPPIMVTSALPYANGPIHLGHLVEYIQTDIWVRYQKLAGREVFYFCADDTHGTPIMIAARNRGISPDQMVEKTHQEHSRDFSYFLVDFDNYYSTNSPENKELSETIYLRSKEKGLIDRKTVNQLYCEHDSMFLPDRFVKGTCPTCGAQDQYGDSCEVCGASYTPAQLKDPACSLCGTPPVLKDSEHLFFKLGEYSDYLKDWLAKPGRVDPGVRKKMDEWLTGGLRNWDISRDGPYFGFPIPGETNKYFYVWLDAPIGYLASAKNYFNKINRSELFDQIWDRKSDAEVYHFIGKDIIYFHTLFWPAILDSADFRTPDAVYVHGFLTLNGEKMSKSRGTLIRAETYSHHLPPEALRYYYASKLGPALDDLDLSTEDFINRFNSDVVGNWTNIFSRLCGGLAKKLDYTLADELSKEGRDLHKTAIRLAQEISGYYKSRQYSHAVRSINALGDEINRFINEQEPWKTIKTSPENARSTITDALTAGRILAALVGPIVPHFQTGVEKLLNLNEPVTLNNLEFVFPAKHTIQPYEALATRIDASMVEAMFEEEKQIAQQGTTDAKKEKIGQAKSKAPDGKSMETEGIITIDDLAKVELKVGKILSADIIEGADRLLQIRLDVGEAEARPVIAGIRAAYAPEDLVGMHVVSVTNLQPRKMKFGESRAMLLAAGEGDSLTLFTPHRTANPGDRLR